MTINHSGGGIQPPLFCASELPDIALLNDVQYQSEALPAALADQWLTAVSDELDWRQRQIMMFGKAVMQPRLTAWHGDHGARYTYSGVTLHPLPWTPALTQIRTWLETCLGARFNGVLANRYRDGNDAMGWHSDDEPELGEQPLIASVSLGAERRFVMRRKNDHGIRHEWVLTHGSLVVMAGRTQEQWQHAVPKTRRVVGERINLTFRQIIHRS